MQNMGKAKEKICIHGFNILSRTHNISAQGLTEKRMSAKDRGQVRARSNGKKNVFSIHLAFTLNSE